MGVEALRLAVGVDTLRLSTLRNSASRDCRLRRLSRRSLDWVMPVGAQFRHSRCFIVSALATQIARFLQNEKCL